MKRQTLSKAHVMVEIPPGANNIHREFPANVSKGPKIHYVQIENERTCLITSIASLLHYAGAKEHASQLFNLKHKLQETTEIWDQLSQCLMSLSKMLKLQSVNYGWV